MLLPLGTMPHGQTSPYSAVSTLAIDPIYIGLDACRDFERAGGVAALSAEAPAGHRGGAAVARRRSTTWFGRAKDEALRLALQLVSWPMSGSTQTPRAPALAGYIERERWWLDDYALFLALSRSARAGQLARLAAALRDRDPRALDEARRQLGRDILLHQYAQWMAEEQWQDARAAAAAARHQPVRRPAVRGRDRQSRRSGRTPTSSGSTCRSACRRMRSARPGQDWGLPTYRWDVIAAGGYAWHPAARARGWRRCYDGLRVDHVIGLYPHVRPAGRAASRSSRRPTKPTRSRRGARVMRMLAESGLALIAEDLGVMPDFVRESLAALGIPGCKVMRWERDWHAPGAPFLEPRVLPGTVGGHDRHARHRAACRLVGRRRTRSERARAASRPAGDLAVWARPTGPTQPGPTRCATVPATRRTAPGRTICSCRFRTCSAGPIASTCRARSGRTTGRGACRGRSIGCATCRRPASAAAFLRRPGGGDRTRGGFAQAGWHTLTPLQPELGGVHE